MNPEDIVRIIVITFIVAVLGGLVGHGIDLLLSDTPSGAGWMMGAGVMGLLGFVVAWISQ